jgi:hypothetical protein
MTSCALSDERIASLDSLVKLASEGPWVTDVNDNGAVFNVYVADTEMDIAIAQQIPRDTNNAQRIINAKYIAAFSPSVLRVLLDDRKTNPRRVNPKAWATLNQLIAGFVEAGVPESEELAKAWRAVNSSAMTE